MATAPLPRRQVEMDAKIDEAIAKIDAALPVIFEKVAQARQSNSTPTPTPPTPTATAGFKVQNFTRTQQTFSQLAREMQESADAFDIDGVDVRVKTLSTQKTAPPRS